MKVSEFIQKLEEFKKENGDVPVVLCADYSGVDIAIDRDDDAEGPGPNINYNQEWYGAPVICLIHEAGNL